MSMYDTVIGFDIVCPKCKKLLKGGFQSKNFLCWNKRIDVHEFEGLMQRWGDSWYRCFVHCEKCMTSFDLEWDPEHKYVLYELDGKDWSQTTSYPIELSYWKNS